MALCTHSPLSNKWPVIGIELGDTLKKSEQINLLKKYLESVKFKLPDLPVPVIGGCRTFGLKFNQRNSQQ